MVTLMIPNNCNVNFVASQPSNLLLPLMYNDRCFGLTKLLKSSLFVVVTLERNLNEMRLTPCLTMLQTS